MLRNSTSITLFDVKTEQTIDTAPCTGFLRVNVNSTIAMCSEATYNIEILGFSILNQGPINRFATPISNLTVTFNGNGHNNVLLDPNCLRGSGGSVNIYNGSLLVNQVDLIHPTHRQWSRIKLLNVFLSEDSTNAKIFYTYRDDDSYRMDLVMTYM